MINSLSSLPVPPPRSRRGRLRAQDRAVGGPWWPVQGAPRLAPTLGKTSGGSAPPNGRVPRPCANRTLARTHACQHPRPPPSHTSCNTSHSQHPVLVHQETTPCRPVPQGVASPLAGQMLFRASLFATFGSSKRWLATDTDGGARALTTADFYKAGAITGFVAAFTEGPIDFFKSQIQVRLGEVACACVGSRWGLDGPCDAPRLVFGAGRRGSWPLRQGQRR
jgi:hypothetical protein